MNMHWESRELALPKLPKGMKWDKIFATGPETAAEEEYVRRLPARSVALYHSVEEQEKTGKRKSRKNG